MENSREKIENLIIKYLNQLSEDEKIVLEIAKKTLKSSFSIEKSIGFLSWYEKNN
jgi:hypothetical protein